MNHQTACFYGLEQLYNKLGICREAVVRTRRLALTNSG